MFGGKQEMDKKGNGEICREGAPVFQIAKGYTGHKAAKPAEKTMSNEKNIFYLFAYKI